MQVLAGGEAVVDAANQVIAHEGADGIAIFAAHRGEVLLDEVVGRSLPQGDPLTLDTRFLLLSCSKALTAAMVALLVERGQLSYDTALAEFFPGFASTPERRQITVGHLASHSAGFPDVARAVTARDWTEWDRGLRLTSELPLESVPGTVLAYHALSFGLLGGVIERATGRSFRQFFATEIACPLQLRTFSWGIAPSVPRTRLGRPEAELTPLADEFQSDLVNASVLPAANGWGTARDLGRFYIALQQATLLDEQTVRTMTTPRTFPAEGVSDNPRSYGFEIGRPTGHVGAAGSLAGDRTYGHMGGGCNIAWCDPDSELVGVVLTNGVCSPEVGVAQLAAISDAIHGLVR